MTPLSYAFLKDKSLQESFWSRYCKIRRLILLNCPREIWNQFRLYKDLSFIYTLKMAFVHLSISQMLNTIALVSFWTAINACPAHLLPPWQKTAAWLTGKEQTIAFPGSGSPEASEQGPGRFCVWWGPDVYFSDGPWNAVISTEKEPLSSVVEQKRVSLPPQLHRWRHLNHTLQVEFHQVPPHSSLALESKSQYELCRRQKHSQYSLLVFLLDGYWYVFFIGLITFSLLYTLHTFPFFPRYQFRCFMTGCFDY